MVETRGDGRTAAVRDVPCLYRVSNGELLWMRDPALTALLEEEEPCMAVKRRGQFVGYACNRPKGHQGRHAAIKQDAVEQSLVHVWDEADCQPWKAQGDGDAGT